MVNDNKQHRIIFKDGFDLMIEQFDSYQQMIEELVSKRDFYDISKFEYLIRSPFGWLTLDNFKILCAVDSHVFDDEQEAMTERLSQRLDSSYLTSQQL